MAKSKTINKNTFWLILIKNLNFMVHNIHVLNVMTILIEEMIADLKNGKEIKLINFGVVGVEKTKPKMIVNVKTGKKEMSGSKNKLYFRISRNLAKYVRKQIESEIEENGKS